MDIPVVFAFSAGMVATVNPCGFAMLPAYIAYHLGLGDESRSVLSRAAYGTLAGLGATAGFVVLFGAVGLVIAAGGYVLTRLFPYWGLGVGVAMAGLGLFLLLTRRSLGIVAASRIHSPATLRGLGGFFLFGIAYGLASLSCTLPIFLVAVGSALASREFVPGLVQFVSYGLGMGAILVLLTLGVVFFKTGFAQGFRVLVPHVHWVGALGMAGAGLYLIYYWTLGTGRIVFS
ncbi:MAG: cytochrome c biogenesis protein CcdA [Chloroflexi bacterium]|nr:cytochrome c biogenesis protein CcdA [Chloroflexota bacterium]